MWIARVHPVFICHLFIVRATGTILLFADPYMFGQLHPMQVRCVLDKKYAAAPDFSRTFDHILLHCGSKSIIDPLEKGLKLTPRMSQPTRDALYRFGNTSSASTW